MLPALIFQSATMDFDSIVVRISFGKYEGIVLHASQCSSDAYYYYHNQRFNVTSCIYQSFFVTHATRDEW